ncbi:unnamed protein product [Didymodactylos carnosus]|uniref:Uncharacterized protein n=1 Tax=Didymodactylos carnosus TaxID=1234261 RepID=A0A813QQF5_9BILA|nr:unnamed protein product [Didymodactylos carnosus]CAF0927079.1 unnamed protein product [Didymodactylos carnosus]CAF3552325.1 unnamed protein product [Didymodactylos carnosus]CAF3704027.1 unnamed protein product [Didymodactylos carnosus]
MHHSSQQQQGNNANTNSTNSTNNNPSPSCDDRTCSNAKCAVCLHCSQQYCFIHFLKHNEQLSLNAENFTLSIDHLDDQLKNMSIDESLRKTIHLLDQWRKNLIKTIDYVYQEKLTSIKQNYIRLTNYLKQFQFEQTSHIQTVRHDLEQMKFIRHTYDREMRKIQATIEQIRQNCKELKYDLVLKERQIPNIYDSIECEIIWKRRSANSNNNNTNSNNEENMDDENGNSEGLVSGNEEEEEEEYFMNSNDGGIHGISPSARIKTELLDSDCVELDNDILDSRYNNTTTTTTTSSSSPSPTSYENCLLSFLIDPPHMNINDSSTPLPMIPGTLAQPPTASSYDNKITRGGGDSYHDSGYHRPIPHHHHSIQSSLPSLLPIKKQQQQQPQPRIKHSTTANGNSLQLQNKKRRICMSCGKFYHPSSLQRHFRQCKRLSMMRQQQQQREEDVHKTPSSALANTQTTYKAIVVPPTTVPDIASSSTTTTTPPSTTPTNNNQNTFSTYEISSNNQ